jgi:hypothetical protein
MWEKGRLERERSKVMYEDRKHHTLFLSFPKLLALIVPIFLVQD